MGNEKDNDSAKASETGKTSAPEDLPPPYVDPITIPTRRESSRKGNEFSEHPGARGKPANDGNGGASKDNEKRGTPE